MDQKTAAALLERYRQGQCTPEEEAMLHRWYEEEAMQPPAARNPVHPSVEEPFLWQRIQDTIHGGGQRRLAHRRRWLYYMAASIVLACVGAWLTLSHQIGEVEQVATTDVAPGHNRATLTLVGGETIDLRADQAGIVVTANEITYSDGSATVVPLPDDDTYDATQQLVLDIPKGGTYAVTLPDGTDVWLNAASTLKYPRRFGTDIREVELVGEAYFDVAKDETRPFRVVSASQAVEVLGTAFNVSAYPDEPETKTTLVEGKIRMTLGGTGTGIAQANPTVVLSPNEQSVVRGGEITKAEVDVSRFVAWREGLIVLDHTDVTQVIRQLERWYDVEFVLEDALPADIQLSGKLPRNVNLSGIIEALQVSTKMNFIIEGRRVMVAQN